MIATNLFRKASPVAELPQLQCCGEQFQQNKVPIKKKAATRTAFGQQFDVALTGRA